MNSRHDQPDHWTFLSSDLLTASVDPLGAQLSSLRDGAGRDLLWNGDPAVWAGRAPLLFPIVGALAGGRYRLGATSYPLSRHGFARGKVFDLVESTAGEALFRLKADETTRPVYPFHFELDVRFALRGATLSVTAAIRNQGEGDLYASIGFHPAFRWPLPFGAERAAHLVEFADDEPAPIRRLDSQGLLRAEGFATPVAARRLVLDDALFKDDVIIFDDLRSRSITYGADTGSRIRVGYPDAPYLGIWTKPGAKFICIEPWHGVADPAGFAGDFKVKPGVFRVAAGESMSTRMDITLLEI
jgi:galactose mutarotase-like enzyme